MTNSPGSVRPWPGRPPNRPPCSAPSSTGPRRRHRSSCAPSTPRHPQPPLELLRLALTESASPYAGRGFAFIAHTGEAHFLPEGNGFLVPAVDGHTLKAASFLSNKWPWLGASAPDTFVLRASIGRIGESGLLDRPDRHLVRTAIAELHHAVGPMGEPVATRVTRWDRGLPQYGVGHWDRVGRIRAAVAELPGLALCGAAYEGAGVAACIATARTAATTLIDTPTAHPAPAGV
ncbi:hypothetical protein [Streptomyces sp. G-G2]|uniref:protoporphyrinogen/coproporphyrinogen oxidase n=1 Tax=Streptomyces sp. G-G2 TaxID=3046201 RepID=UPI0024BBD30E|nr:hypothetical protein [Streptomyces sp. G-G2]MDJ0384404.1 hypothetical protein [Streptomyces sp. G-G2]